MEGPTTEKFVEEVKQETMQSAAEVVVMQVELGDICSKISVLAE